MYHLALFYIGLAILYAKAGSKPTQVHLRTAEKFLLVDYGI